MLNWKNYEYEEQNGQLHHLYAELTVRCKRASRFQVFLTPGVFLTLFIKKMHFFFFFTVLALQ